MKIKKIVLPMLLLSVLFLGACGDKDSGGEKKAVKSSDGVYSPTLTINVAKQLDENAGRYAKGDDINKNPMIKLGEKDLGIKIKTTLLGGDAGNYDTKLRLALTGSEDLPDAFPVYGTQMIADMIESGRVKAIDKDIDKYMPARLKKIYKKYPETFYPVTKNGKTYGFANLPMLDDGQVLIIRQDWLDKLNLKAPTNMAEFEQVLKAFSEDDPDGNGKNDTYGFTYGGNDIYNTGWVADPVMLFSANTGKNLPGSWQKNSDGQLTYGSIAEGNKATLQKMSEWHKNGWLFKEAAATGAWDAMGEFTEGKAGMFVGRPWAIGSVADLTKNVKAAKIKAYPTINQDNGDPTYQNSSVNDGWFMFNKNFKNMKAFFEYYDWLYDVAFSTGSFKYGYLKGYDYEKKDGKMTVYDPTPDEVFNPAKAIITKNRPYVDKMKPYYDVVNGKKAVTGPEIIAESKLETTPEVAQGEALAYEKRDLLIPNLFNGEPTPTMKKNWEQLQTLEKQTYTNIIYGKQPISAYDKFVKQWKSDGGDKITKEVNKWYSSVK